MQTRVMHYEREGGQGGASKAEEITKNKSPVANCPRALIHLYETKKLVFFVFEDLHAFVLAAAGANVMRTFGFAAVGAGDDLNGRKTIVDGTTHHGAGMGNAFLRNCHVNTPEVMN